MKLSTPVIAFVLLGCLSSGAKADLVSDVLQSFRPNQMISETVRDEAHRYWWVKSPLRRPGGEFVLEREDRVDVRYARWRVYQIDRSHDQRDIFEQIRNLWVERDNYEEIFSCQGSGCGNSQHWANNVFGESRLYGLDRHQHYSTGTVGDDIRTLYVVRRGSQLNYVYWLEAVRTNPADRLADDLAGGDAILAQSFPPQVWNDVLNNNPDWNLVLVGHDYADDFDTAEANGLVAAENVWDTWANLDIDSDRVRIESVGYLAPRSGQGNRVTVILPPGFHSM